jgi:hypothetical protein
MIYQSVFRRITNPFRHVQNVIKGVYIREQLTSNCSIELTTDEASFIDSLRGLNGLRAKRKAFDYAITVMGYSYDFLVETFPTYQTDRLN